jgi:hypothetical protein
VHSIDIKNVKKFYIKNDKFDKYVFKNAQEQRKQPASVLNYFCAVCPSGGS